MPASAWVTVLVRWDRVRGQWTVTQTDGKTTASFEKKDEAVWEARQLAQKTRPSRLVLYRMDGTEEQTFSYAQKDGR